MNDNLLTSYSFLAALSENQTDIYNTVYLPLFKRAISSYASKNNSKSSIIHGIDTDIQSIIIEEYSLDIPILIVRKLIKKVATSLSKKERSSSNFACFEEGKSFQFSSYSFTNKEQIYDKARRDSQSLYIAFNDYIRTKTENLSEKDIPTFSIFLEKNKKNLSSFFSGKTRIIEEKELEQSFMHHIHFLQDIERSDNTLYEVAERIYMGSIIASFLESGIELEAKIDDNIIYYLDTQIILEALDLQREEDTLPTKELLKLIRDTKGEVKILNITINEISLIIEQAISKFDKDNPISTINEACIRLGKNKTWLININGKLEDFIRKELGVEVDTVPDSEIRKNATSEDVALLGQTRRRKNSAIHDVTAYLYVRKRRGNNIRLHQKAKYWFVTANKNLSEFNITCKTNGFIGETIMPDELTSLLFLKNPQHLAARVSQIGLNELIAQTLSEEYPSRELLNEFDMAIRENLNLKEEDYNILLNSIAFQSTKSIQGLLDEAGDKQKFANSTHKLIEKGRNEKAKSEKEMRQYEKKIKSINEENIFIKKENKKLKSQIAENRKMEEKKARYFPIKTSNAIIIILIVLVLYLYTLLHPELYLWIKRIIYFISSSGGLWGFANLLFNLAKHFFNTKS